MQAPAALSVVASRSLGTIETNGIAQVIVCGGEAIAVDRTSPRGPDHVRTPRPSMATTKPRITRLAVAPPRPE